MFYLLKNMNMILTIILINPGKINLICLEIIYFLKTLEN